MQSHTRGLHWGRPTRCQHHISLEAVSSELLLGAGEAADRTPHGTGREWVQLGGQTSGHILLAFPNTRGCEMLASGKLGEGVQELSVFSLQRFCKRKIIPQNVVGIRMPWTKEKKNPNLTIPTALSREHGGSLPSAAWAVPHGFISGQLCLMPHLPLSTPCRLLCPAGRWRHPCLFPGPR